MLAAIYLVTMLFTELMSNNAAAVLIFPIAWQTAADMGLNPMPFVMALTGVAESETVVVDGTAVKVLADGSFSEYVRKSGLGEIVIRATGADAQFTDEEQPMVVREESDGTEDFARLEKLAARLAEFCGT